MTKHNTVILSGIAETIRHERGMTVTSFNPSGDPHAAAIVHAVMWDYHQVTERPEPTRESLEALAGHKVSMLRTGENMFGAGSIGSTEGTIVMSRGRLAFMHKGARTNGFLLDPDKVLDVEEGYGKTDFLTGLVHQVRATFPVLEELTQEHLDALPEEAPNPAQIGLVVFGSWRGPDVRSPGAVWLLHSYMHEDDIAEGYLLVRPEHGESEHGSIYGRQLLHVGGRVVNPPAMSFAQAMDLGSLDYHKALAQIVGA